MTDDGAALFVHEIDGDNTGRATARRAQSIKTDLNRALMEFSVLTQRESELQLPPSIDCREIDLYIKGRIFHLFNCRPGYFHSVLILCLTNTNVWFVFFVVRYYNMVYPDSLEV
jgi:hypothetical protein